MAIVLGLDAKLFRGTAGTQAATEVTNVKDLTLNMETGEADVTTRATRGWKATAATLKEASLEFNILYDPADADFTAFQIDITLDGDAKLKRDSIHCGSLLADHNIMLGMPNGQYRLAAYNMGNKKLNGKEGELVSFTVVGDLKGIAIGGITFVNSDCNSVKPDLKCKANDGDAKKEKEATYGMKGPQTYSIDRRGISIRREKE